MLQEREVFQTEDKMKNKVLLFLLFPLLTIGGCTSHAPTPVTAEQEQPVQTSEVARFKLTPTKNMWTFLKLDTQTGKIWQAQYSINDSGTRFECALNPHSLASTTTNGRFELYPTENLFNFILLDQINGKMWQVQWSFEEDKRYIIPIN